MNKTERVGVFYPDRAYLVTDFYWIPFKITRPISYDQFMESIQPIAHIYGYRCALSGHVANVRQFKFKADGSIDSATFADYFYKIEVNELYWTVFRRIL